MTSALALILISKDPIMFFSYIFKLFTLLIILSFSFEIFSQHNAATNNSVGDKAPFQISKRVVLENYKGDFDHLAADFASNRLFVAGEDGGSLEVFNMQNLNHIASVKGFDEPHAIYLDKKRNRIIVSYSGESMTKILDINSYKVVGQVKLISGADVMAYDSSNDNLWIVNGGKNSKPKLDETTISIISLASNEKIKDIVIDSNFVEGIAFEEKGNRAFVNVAGKSVVAVIDKKSFKVTDKWALKIGENNSSIALDEDNHRLFVVTRKPFKLDVINTDNGQEIAGFDIPKRTNELVYDKKSKRIYAFGDDYIATFSQVNANQYVELPRSLTTFGGKTGLLAAEMSSLFVAVSPGDKPIAAEIIKMTSN